MTFLFPSASEHHERWGFEAAIRCITVEDAEEPVVPLVVLIPAFEEPLHLSVHGVPVIAVGERWWRTVTYGGDDRGEVNLDRLRAAVQPASRRHGIPELRKDRDPPLRLLLRHAADYSQACSRGHSGNRRTIQEGMKHWHGLLGAVREPVLRSFTTRTGFRRKRPELAQAPSVTARRPGAVAR